MREKIYIYTHQGMGDQMLCNGLIRHFAEIYDVIAFSKPHFKNNVDFMYKDNPYIKIKYMDDENIKKFLQFLNANVLIIGHTQEFIQKVDIEKTVKFDEMFYKMAKIPLEYKWSKFYIERNIKREKEVFYDILKLKDNEEFLFIHDDPKRNRIFKDKYIDINIKAIRPNDFLNVGIFDFIYTLEKAKQIHVFSSGFSCMLDAMDFNHSNLYYHHYIGFNPKSGLLPHYDHALKKEKWHFLID